MKCSVPDTLHIFLILYKTINMFPYASVYATYFLYLGFVYFHNLFHITDGCILWCACAFIHWMKEVFTIFIHTNITITWFFFLLIRAQSISLTLFVIRTWRFFVFIRFLVVRNRCVDTFLFLPVHRSNSRLIFLLTCTIVLLTSDLTPLGHIQMCFLVLISL